MYNSLIPMTKELDLSSPLDSGLVLAVLLAGLGIVFLALIVLILFISGMGAVFTIKKKPAPVKAEPAPVINTPAPAKIENDSDEVIAVISAAVTMMGQTDEKVYKIKSISPTTNTRKRSAWGLAGLRDNTTPF